jgi:hypothetical protein
LIVAALTVIVTCSICLGSRSLALAVSTLATPVAVVEPPSPTPSPALSPAETPSPLPSPTETAAATPTSEFGVASPISSTAVPSPATTSATIPTLAAPTESIRVSAVTEDQATKPGATTGYRFRIENGSSVPASVKLAATNSAAGWSAEIFDANGSTQITQAISIPAGGFVDVIVRVTAPPAARAGDQNSTTLVASVIS